MKYNFEKRISKLRKLFDVLEIDSMIVYQGYNNEYLTGFSGGSGEGMFALSRDHALLVTDRRYQEAYQNNLPNGVDLKISRDYYGETARILNSWEVKKVGFEEDLPFCVFDFLDGELEAEFVPTPAPIEALREIKDAQELENLHQATKRSVTAFNHLLDWIKVGQTEKEIADQLDYLARHEGLEKTSFDTIVASGENSAKPHGTASNRKIKNGDLVTIDFGYYFNHYTSDITRTIAIGEIDPKLSNIYQIVKEAQELSIKAIKPDVDLKEVDKASRSYIETKGYGKEYNHGGGHGVGLDIHEGPAVSPGSEDESTVGQILTIEPGIYISGLGGVRIEDDVLVMRNGFENLTDGITRDLIKIEK
ncbi:aminopeptidase P family protein [Oenococcus sp. UCMA 16435]|nr:aminopeptidase P family protein [Oenococcus sp. UCMA 16435]MDI4584043.1 M24 family metallopeptidase [Oenococcus sp. UCMA 14587]